MKGRYFIEISRNVPNAGTEMIRVGLPIYQDMVNDIVVGCRGSYEFIALNANVLRQALLDNPEQTKKLLGLEVKDATIKTVKKAVKKEEVKKEEENKDERRSSN